MIKSLSVKPEDRIQSIMGYPILIFRNWNSHFALLSIIDF